MTIGDIPDDFINVVKEEFVQYSVALGRLRDGDAVPYLPLGSGVFVKRRERYGILTAHHCLHETQVSIGKNGTDRLALMTHRSLGRVLSPNAVQEHELAGPINFGYNAFGPDITFLEILPGEELGSIKGEVSFYSLDRSAVEVKERWSAFTTPLAHVGFPACDNIITETSRGICHQMRHMTFMGAIAKNSVTARGGWDYLETGVTYADSNTKLPEHFDGVSGGPIWALVIKKAPSGALSTEDFALVGITFWQTKHIGNQCVIRGHFIDSIYDLAWRQLPPANEVFVG